MKRALVIGYGAIGRLVLDQLADDRTLRITHLLVRPSRKDAISRALGGRIQVIGGLDDLDALPDCALECAGHGAVAEYVAPLLEREVDLALVSVGALAEPGLPEKLEAAARKGGSQITLVSGAIGGLDAIAAARMGGLDEVTYTGRKPPLGWLGSPAERKVDLESLANAAVIFEGTARDAARLYPKNANVAATVSLAGLGLDRTHVTLVADPAVSRNVHHVVARGAFGEMEITFSGNPLAENPKTSALAAYAAVRALRDFAALVRF